MTHAAMPQDKLVTVLNETGVHARPAAMIVKLTSCYTDTEVTISKGDQQANAKSIMSLMMLAADCGSQLRISAEGPSSSEIIDKLSNLFERHFEE